MNLNRVSQDGRSKQPDNKDWKHVWKSSSTEQNGKPVVAKGSETNAFKFK
jgi:hypothetical protein